MELRSDRRGIKADITLDSSMSSEPIGSPRAKPHDVQEPQQHSNNRTNIRLQPIPAAACIALLPLVPREVSIYGGVGPTARAEQLEKLMKLLQESEEDRAMRLQQIEILTSMVKESEADLAARGQRIEVLVENLRALFSRPGFRWLAGIAGWPEVKKLAEQFKSRNE